MQEYQALKDLRQHLVDNWNEPGCAIYFPNESYKEDKYFCVLSILHADTEEFLFGSSSGITDRYNGVFSFNFFGPTGQGTGILLNLVEKMSDILGHRTIANRIRCTTSNLTEIGVVDDISKYVINISVVYRRDDPIEIKP